MRMHAALAELLEKKQQLDLEMEQVSSTLTKPATKPLQQQRTN